MLQNIWAGGDGVHGGGGGGEEEEEEVKMYVDLNGMRDY